MKRVLSVLLALCIVLILCACGAESEPVSIIDSSEKAKSTDTPVDGIIEADKGESHFLPDESAEAPAAETEAAPEPQTSSEPAASAESGAEASEPAAEETGSASSEYQMTEVVIPVVGGFSPVEDGRITSELQKLYNDAVAGTEASSYAAICLVATQVVAGTNYQFFCASPEEVLKTVIVYQDLSGSVSLLRVEDIG